MCRMPYVIQDGETCYMGILQRHSSRGQEGTGAPWAMSLPGASVLEWDLSLPQLFCPLMGNFMP